MTKQQININELKTPIFNYLQDIIEDLVYQYDNITFDELVKKIKNNYYSNMPIYVISCNVNHYLENNK